MEKVAVITGGAKGIGKAISQNLAKNAIKVIILSRGSADEHSALEKEIGQNILYIQCDVSNTSEVENAFKTIQKDHPCVDILINNAGIVNASPAEVMPFEMWQEMININLSGAFYCSQMAAKTMIDSKKPGVIVNISSVTAQTIIYPYTHCHYNVSKAGIESLTKSLAAEWAKYNIRVNCIAPGFVKTQMTENRDELLKKWFEHTPMNRRGETHEIANVVDFLVSEKSSFMTGSIVNVDGGFCCL